MITLLLRRLLHAVAVIAVAVTLGFALIRLPPGDALSGDTTQVGRSAASRDLLRARYGMDAPISAQWLGYVIGAVRGDLGTSVVDGRPVSAMLGTALGNSLVLSGTGLLAAIVVGTLVGGAQGWRPRWLPGRAIGTALTATYAMPEFVLAIGLIGILSYATGWFPVGGMHDPITTLTGSARERLADLGAHLVVPSLALALGWGAAIARQQRVALAETVGTDFVRSARAKGVSEGGVLLHHALRPSLSSVTATIGLMLPVLVGGAVVIEVVFAWPGMGTLLLRAVGQRDTPVVSGAIIVIAAAVSASTLLVELAVRALDPRLRR